MQLGFGFYSKSEALFSDEEANEVFDGNFFREYVETKWLDRYWMMNATASKTTIPSITATISDMPSSITNEFRSTTESSAEKSIYADEWLKVFHENLSLLPNDYQKLIHLKYLNRRGDGNKHSDDAIYPQLNVSRSKFYNMQRVALEELGRRLYRVQYQES